MRFRRLLVRGDFATAIARPNWRHPSSKAVQGQFPISPFRRLPSLGSASTPDPFRIPDHLSTNIAMVVPGGAISVNGAAQQEQGYRTDLNATDMI
jgi:hypothetical protein